MRISALGAPGSVTSPPRNAEDDEQRDDGERHQDHSPHPRHTHQARDTGPRGRSSGTWTACRSFDAQELRRPRSPTPRPGPPRRPAIASSPTRIPPAETRDTVPVVPQHHRGAASAADDPGRWTRSRERTTRAPRGRLATSSRAQGCTREATRSSGLASVSREVGGWSTLVRWPREGHAARGN